jgi:Bacterial Ig domain
MARTLRLCRMVRGPRGARDGNPFQSEDFVQHLTSSCRSRATRVLLSITVALVVAFAVPFSHSNASAQSQTGTVVLSPTDTFINLNQQNYGTSPTLNVYTWPDYQVANATILKFDLSSVPAGAVVQSARLKLALVESDSRAETTYVVSAHKIIGRNPDPATATGYQPTTSTAWAASNCCYGGIPLAQGNISAAYSSLAVNKTNGVKVWTITSMVQEWLANPSTNYGVLLNSDASQLQNRYRYFASMEYPDPTQRPQLEITFAASDATPPAVSLTSPTSGAVLSSTVTLTAAAADASGIAAVQFRLNDNALGQEVANAPYAMSWNTAGVADGSYTLTAVARDTTGNTATSVGVGVNVRNGALTFFPSDTTINLNTTNYSSGNTLNTYTWPDGEIANAILMKFDLSSIPVGATVQDATLHLALVESDATSDATYTIGAHKIVNRNPVIASANGYTFDGTTPWAPPPSACCYTSIPLAQGDITSAYDQRAIDKTPGDKQWSLTRMVQEWVSAPSSNFGVLLNSDLTKRKDRYRFFGSTKHASASLRPYLSVRLSGSTVVTGDTSAPTVSLTTPSPLTTVTGSAVTVSASASDNIGVAGVQFKVDGNDIGGEDLIAPYATTWNSSGVANGTHTLTAVARDAAGNQRTSSGVSVTVSNTTTSSISGGGSTSVAGIAALYPGDAGIENDSRVLFVEQFEEGSVSTVGSRWGDIRNPGNMTFSTDVPAGSASGSHSLVIASHGGVDSGGHLYKILNPAITDTIYIRWYIKTSTVGKLHHSGVWTGGFNPLYSWPTPGAGSRPNGSDKFMVAAEQNENIPAFDHYNYWVGMHPDGGGAYWGDFLLNNPAVQQPKGEWSCVEQMVKLNNPVSAFNGEQAIWLNGVKVSHLGPGFPRGYWQGGIFTQDPSGQPFEGFQWRNSTALNLNFLWLQNYTDNPSGVNATMLFDHVVVATSYIGCLQ